MPTPHRVFNLPALRADGASRALACPDGPARSLAIAELAQQVQGPLVVVATGEQQAHRIEQEVRFFAGDAADITHMPDPEILPYDLFSPHQEILSARMRCLYELPNRTSGVVVITADTLTQRMPPREWLAGRAFNLTVGEAIDPAAFRSRLAGAGYQSVSEVQTQGEFAIRGAIIDLFPMGSDAAYRLDLFDNEVESIREFDPETQRSVRKLSNVRLLPAREFPTEDAGIESFRRNYRAYFTGDPSRSRIYEQVSRGVMPAGIESYLPLFFERTDAFLDFVPESAHVAVLGDLDTALDTDWSEIGDRFERRTGDIERPLMAPDDLFVSPDRVREALSARTMTVIDDSGTDLGAVTVSDEGDPLAERVKTHDGRLLLVAESAGRREAARDWLKPMGLAPRDVESWRDFADDTRRIGLIIGPVQDSVLLPDGTLLLSESQIFGLHAKVSRRRKPVRDPDTILRDLGSLQIGSPVVHVEHGVGRYAGLTRLDAGGLDSEYLILEFAGDDKLYVPITSLHQVHRFTGAEPENAPLHQLGNERWERAKARARKRARDVAAELLDIQARRQARAGVSMAVESADYQRFCEGFPFETTADQQSAVDAVLADLAAETPMDRVVCGDVGFGKTEVALRASFAAVNQGFQVCVLAPTTLLAQQHGKNFEDRFADWPVRVGVASRLRSAKEINELIKSVADGSIDIIIGTHRLLQDDVHFDRLGLVIIDEEHRFGVRHKERMKRLRAEVDLLTLTATPIPRTLNMGLAGLRDLSIIATPPPSRLSIRTFVTEWDRGQVFEACQRELRRGGQIYYLHNEVRDIEQTAESLSRIVPQARVRVAHGQMRERELEQVMLDFYHQRFDVLVCTTIIESGIDVPTANTILIDRADKLGLAQLHQLRGRVGRSHHRAYAYLMVPSRRALSGDALKRLEAIEAMGDLGSGFTLATHDLEIRGAGELLGEGQSGQMEEIGFTLYADLLSRAVDSIRHGGEDDALEPIDNEIDLGLSAMIPDDHVPDIHTRLTLYKRIADADTPDALAELRVELIDRFGPLPAPTDNLLTMARLRLRLQTIGVKKARASDDRIVLDFVEKPAIDPARIIMLIQRHPKRYRLDGQSRLIHFDTLEDKSERAESLGQLLDRLTESPNDTN